MINLFTKLGGNPSTAGFAEMYKVYRFRDTCLLLPTTDIHTLMVLDLSARYCAFKHAPPALSILPVEWHQR